MTLVGARGRDPDDLVYSSAQVVCCGEGEPKWNDAQRRSDGNLTNFAKTGLLEAGKNCAQGLLSSLNEV
ncbi:MAG: hypothetical protein Ct9H300mP31_09310 [Acidimicrobiaceae bacterium]|nr:MAG: hypothetical protein Ct9H300mP31_09310 [Acidimicrobiaceae bacterium]